jgi:hypothetical protein
MKRLCDRFDPYRDGMLAPQAQRQFEMHMEACVKCRTRLLFLNNLVRVVQNRPLPGMTRSPEQLAAGAYQELWSWDFLCVSWLRPGVAWSGLALLAILLLFLWTSTSTLPVSADSEYEALMQESDSIGGRGGSLTALPDDGFELWLGIGGSAK